MVISMSRGRRPGLGETSSSTPISAALGKTFHVPAQGRRQTDFIEQRRMK
jgi:hypothetical protein